MDIQQKIKIFENSCKKMLGKESAELNLAIDMDIQQQIKDEIEEYEKKEEFAYNKKIEKLEKDYNKEMYLLETDSKKEILKQKKLVQKDLLNEMITLLIDFTKSSEYTEFLKKRIEEVLSKINEPEQASLYLVSTDYDKYGKIISEQYKVQVQKADEKYIGGCILEDQKQGIYIDNTLYSSLEENLEC